MHWQEIQTDLPSLSYMMDFVPFATPQTFSRMVVLPALALPMTRMQKYGHRYCSLSIWTCVSSVSDTCQSRISNAESHKLKEGAPVVAAMTDVVLGSRSDCLFEGVMKMKYSPEIMEKGSDAKLGCKCESRRVVYGWCAQTEGSGLGYQQVALQQQWVQWCGLTY